MKTQRRQELRTNDLAQMLEGAQEFFRAWGSYVVGGAVVIVLAIAFMVYRAKAGEQELSDAWQSLAELRQKSFFTQSREKRTDLEINTGFDGLQRLADEAKETNLVFDALLTQGAIATQLSMMGEAGADPVYLDKAEQAYSALKDRLPDNPMAVATALNGLVSVEADRFVLDEDPSHKRRAREILEQLRDDPRFANTPFQRSALDRLNRLDDVFRAVRLAPAPAPVVVTPVAGPPAPAVTATPPEVGKVRLRTAPPALAEEEPEGPGTESGESIDITPASPEDLAEPERVEPGDE